MWTDLATRYSRIAAGSRISSQFGALIILVIAIIETIRIGQQSLAVGNLSRGALWNGGVPVGLFLIAFGLRFVLLFQFASSIFVRAITWWLSFAVFCFCLKYFGPEPGVIYSFFHTFPLVTSGMIFVFVGCLRFLYFASVSLKNDVNPNS